MITEVLNDQDGVASSFIQGIMSSLRRLADRLAEPTVILSYTAVGYGLRKPLWDDRALEKDLTGKVMVVTGANAGLGFATARALAERHATVIMACRNVERGERAREKIVRETGNDAVELALLDVADLSSVRAFVRQFEQEHDHLDVLLHNAGVLVHERSQTADGVETTFATHVLGPFVLTHLLRDRLGRGASPRVIWVTSGGMYTTSLNVDDLQFERGSFDGVKAYAQCKRAQMMLTEAWAQELRGDGIAVHATHPGWADTPGVETALPRFHRILGPILRDAEQGADTAVWLAVSEDAARVTGKLWFDRAQRRTHVLPWTKSKTSDVRVLWDTCRRLGGIGTDSDSS